MNSGTADGASIFLRAENSARSVTIQSGLGNIFLRGGNKGLLTTHTIHLIRVGTNWFEPGARRQATDITEMKAMLKSSFSEDELIDLKWRTTAGDGGIGIFRVTKTNISANVTLDTTGGIFIPFDSDTTGASGGFIREFNGAANVKWFGAVIDGVTDDLAACQAAYDTFNEIIIPTGTTIFNGTLNLSAVQSKIVGERGTVVKQTGSVPSIKQTTHGFLTRIKGIKFTGNGPGFTHNPASTSTNTLYEYLIQDCEFFNDAGVYGLEFINGREGFIDSCWFEVCKGLLIQNSVNISISSCGWRNTEFGVNCNGDGGPFTAGARIIGCTMLGCVTGVQFKLGDNHIITGCLIDLCDNPIVIDGQDTCTISSSYITSRTANPTISIKKNGVTTSKEIKITDCFVLGASPPSGHISILIADASGVTISGCDITFFFLHGISYSNTTFLQVTQCKFSSATGTNSVIVTAGDSSSNKFFQNIFNLPPSVTSALLINNRGFLTENKGNVTLLSGNTTQSFAHGLAFTPGKEHFSIIPTNITAGQANWWLDVVDATNFAIKLDAAAGANMGFSFTASKDI